MKRRAHAKRVDENQAGIVRRLNQIPGVEALVIHEPCDIMVGRKRRNWLFEVKNPDKPGADRRLTEKQAEFHARWPGQIDKVETFEEIWEIIG